MRPFSAKVEIELVTTSGTLKVAQAGPGFLILRGPTMSISPGDLCVLTVTIDGHSGGEDIVVTGVTLDGMKVYFRRRSDAAEAS